MTDLLRIVVDAGLFFVSCTVVFLVGFVVDAWAQARRAARSAARAANAEAADRAARAGGDASESLKPASAATA